MKRILLLAAAVVTPMLVSAQATRRPEILVLGTYHMDSPGRDIFNAKVDDVMSAKRQKEMAQVLDVLKRFAPTKIAVEASVTSGRTKSGYSAYLEGKYTLTPNEIDQLGFRLARELGHKTVYAVDEDGDFPFYRVRNYAIANGKKDQFEAMQAVTGARVKEQNEFLATHSILDMLELLNADSSAARAVNEYYTSFMPFGEPWEYAGADLIASWFQRNLRIYHNVRALATAPDDRILVIYGSGHLGWLRQIISADRAVQLKTLADLTPRR